MTTSIVINLTVEGLHRWPTCNIDDVGFLRAQHRHIFHVCCKKTVSHLNRDIEIICFKREVKAYLENKYGTPCCDFGTMSCEMIAEELVTIFSLSYCSVLEDGENGAEITNC